MKKASEHLYHLHKSIDYLQRQLDFMLEEGQTLKIEMSCVGPSSSTECKFVIKLDKSIKDYRKSKQKKVDK